MSAPRPRHTPPSPSPAWPALATPWVCAGIFLAVLLAYWPALHGTFLWDDDGHVTRPDLRPLGGLARIWFEIGATQQYYPLLHSTFWVEHRLWGDAPLGYHLVNIFFHATAACLAGVALRRLAVPGAWLAAALFALHPVCVESVAWISEQKNTLSAVLYLLALLVYLDFDDSRRGRPYALATGLFLLALLTKTITASLPAALLVIFWWRRGRLEWRRDVLPLLPWFVLSAVAGVTTALFEHTLIGARGADFELGAAARVLIAGRALWFYLGKLLWPADLVFIYPRWTPDPAVWWQWLFPLAALAAFALLWRWRTHRGPLAAALFFAGTLFPGLGFINVFPFRYSFVADHFQYLAMLGPLAAFSAWLVTAVARRSLALVTTAVPLGLLTLGVLSWRQSGTYRDVFVLYYATLERNPSCWMAHNNLGMALTDAGDPAAAIPHYEQALRLQPANAEAENNLGFALARLDRHAEAEPHYRRALQFQPDYAVADNNLGATLMALGRTNEGLSAFTAALKANPRYAGAHANLGLALARLGRTEEAIGHFRAAVQYQPDFAVAELNLAIGLMLTNRFAESRPHFEHALALDPTNPAPRLTYGRALADHGLPEEAIAQFRAALGLDPNLAAAHYALALALRQTGRKEEAQHHYLEAQRLSATSR